jgi:hypothetical protein
MNLNKYEDYSDDSLKMKHETEPKNKTHMMNHEKEPKNKTHTFPQMRVHNDYHTPQPSVFHQMMMHNDDHRTLPSVFPQMIHHEGEHTNLTFMTPQMAQSHTAHEYKSMTPNNIDRDMFSYFVNTKKVKGSKKHEMEKAFRADQSNSELNDESSENSNDQSSEESNENSNDESSEGSDNESEGNTFPVLNLNYALKDETSGDSANCSDSSSSEDEKNTQKSQLNITPHMIRNVDQIFEQDVRPMMQSYMLSCMQPNMFMTPVLNHMNENDIRPEFIFKCDTNVNSEEQEKIKNGRDSFPHAYVPETFINKLNYPFDTKKISDEKYVKSGSKRSINNFSNPKKNDTFSLDPLATGSNKFSSDSTPMKLNKADQIEHGSVSNNMKKITTKVVQTSYFVSNNEEYYPLIVKPLVIGDTLVYPHIEYKNHKIQSKPIEHQIEITLFQSTYQDQEFYPFVVDVINGINSILVPCVSYDLSNSIKSEKFDPNKKEKRDCSVSTNVKDKPNVTFRGLSKSKKNQNEINVPSYINEIKKASYSKSFVNNDLNAQEVDDANESYLPSVDSRYNKNIL